MIKHAIVFDLDGTLWDTSETCAKGWNNVIERYGFVFRKITVDDVRRVMGKPHELCIRETFAGLTEQEIEVLIADTMIEDNVMVEKLGGNLYDGVALGLRTLAERFSLYIVSNCQAGYIETFLNVHNVGNLFQDFECWGNTRKSKSDNLAAIIARNSLKSSVMVGDMESDMLAAKACGIPFIHASYGFGRVDDCERSFKSFSELCGFLIEEGA